VEYPDREAHLSAEQTRPQAAAWLFEAHGEHGRPHRAVAAPRKGPQTLVGLSMAALARLKRRAEFLRVAGYRKKWVAPGLILQAAPSTLAAASKTRIGFTASRKVGIAVDRNRARRRLKAAVAAMMPLHAATGHDYVLIARTGTVRRPYAALLGDLETGLKSLGLWR
jgi:ribonuclease P protein component